MSTKETICIAVFGKHQASAPTLWRGIAELLHENGYHVIVDENTKSSKKSDFEAVSIGEIKKRAHYAVIIGGDGTFLGVARELAGMGIPLIGVNQGRLGFLTDIRLHDIDPILLDTLAGDSLLERRTYLSGNVIRNGEKLAQHIALNDIVISRGIVGGMVDLRVEVDGRFVYDLRADGLIVSTPTGSTAYALSADGPILHPSMKGVLLVPVAPHALTNRPIVLPRDSCIVVEIKGGRQTGFHFDMQTTFRGKIGDRVEIRVADEPIELLHPGRYDYYAMLRQKLHWSTRFTDLNNLERGLRESFHAK